MVLYVVGHEVVGYYAKLTSEHLSRYFNKRLNHWVWLECKFTPL